MLQQIIEPAIEPVFAIQWQNVVIIVLTGILASAIILISTMRSVRRIGLETAKMVGSLEAAHRGSAPVGNALITVGRGEVTWHEGGSVALFVARLRPKNEDLSDMAAEAVSSLVQALVPLGIEAGDIAETDPVMATEEVGVVSARVAVRDPTIYVKVVEVALRCSFSEERSGVREEITEADAHRVAGERAVEDALRNLDTLSTALRIDRTSLEMIGGDLETGDASGRVVKIARTHWRPAA